MKTKSLSRAALTETEINRLNELTEIIRRNRDGAKACYAALQEVRDRKLYRATHATFDGYCREVMRISSGQANRIISADKICKQLTDESGARARKNATGDTKNAVLSGRATSALAEIPPENRATIWDMLEKQGEPVTAKAVKKAVEATADRTLPKTPWDDWLPKVEAWLTKCRQLANEAREIFDFGDKPKDGPHRSRVQWGWGCTYGMTIEPLNQVVREVSTKMPVALSLKPPGFLMRWQVKK